MIFNKVQSSQTDDKLKVSQAKVSILFPQFVFLLNNETVYGGGSYCRTQCPNGTGLIPKSIVKFSLRFPHFIIFIVFYNLFIYICQHSSVPPSNVGRKCPTHLSK